MHADPVRARYPDAQGLRAAHFRAAYTAADGDATAAGAAAGTAAASVLLAAALRQLPPQQRRPRRHLEAVLALQRPPSSSRLPAAAHRRRLPDALSRPAAGPSRGAAPQQHQRGGRPDRTAAAHDEGAARARSAESHPSRADPQPCSTGGAHPGHPEALHGLPAAFRGVLAQLHSVSCTACRSQGTPSSRAATAAARAGTAQLSAAPGEAAGGGGGLPAAGQPRQPQRPVAVGLALAGGLHGVRTRRAAAAKVARIGARVRLQSGPLRRQGEQPAARGQSATRLQRVLLAAAAGARRFAPGTRRTASRAAGRGARPPAERWDPEGQSCDRRGRRQPCRQSAPSLGGDARADADV